MQLVPVKSTVPLKLAEHDAFCLPDCLLAPIDMAIQKPKGAAVMAFTQKAAASTQEATIPEKSRGENGGLRERVRSLESQLAKAESEKAKAEDKSRPGQEEAEMELDVGEAETLPPPVPKITEAKRPVVIIKRIEPFKEAVKVLRPEVQGRKKEMGESREEAMEGIRQVMEGISISAITSETDPASMRGKLEDVILRCQGVMSRLPVRKNKDKDEERKPHPEEKKADDVSRQTRSDRKKGGKSGGRVDEAKGTSTKPDKEMPKPQRVPRQAQTKTLQKEEQLREKKADPPQRKGNYAEAAKKPAKRAQPAERKSAPQRPKGSNEVKNAPKRKEAATQPAGKGRGPEQRNRRTPRSEAVSIMFPAREFAQGMRDIRSKVNLDELGIGPLKQRKARNEVTDPTNLLLRPST
ncbi:PREDICTED: neurofilament heavy polypeptide-like [Vollenhovia emeryi]|uniref:neurofilament heavy polypeptide-like n=1 Tax=Vollenhovia emeryi TaxID=411798 RepID=UPI0005F41A02|nr:PREDICTED: neurofilament heavy polypeptide-like [Vollenhovia emeryi]